MRRLAFSVVSLVLAATSALACSSSTEDETSDDALEGNVTANAAVEVPFYFAVTKQALTHMTARERSHPYPTAWNPSRETGEAGLRIIAVKDTGASARAEIGAKLAASGVLKTGDVVLTFRPELADTIPYAHIQMGTTHSGLVRIQNNVAHSVDQPLDTEHNSPGKSFQSPHYMGVKALHIVRPRVIEQNPNRRDSLDRWLGRAEALIGRDGRAGFNDNYISPAVAHPSINGDAAKLATTIGKGLLNGNLRSVLPDMDPSKPGEQQLFCSELAYHLLTLSNCSEEEVRSAGDVAECTRGAQPFPLMPMVGDSSPSGLGEGPLLSILAAKGAELNPADLANIVFTPKNTESPALSSGHRTANTMLTQMGAIGGLKMLYGLRAQQPNAPLPAPLQALRQKIPANYSPTAYLIDTLGDATQRQFDYVATVVFLNDAQFQKAKEISRNPIPNTDAP
jgi:hypothetical protein